MKKLLYFGILILCVSLINAADNYYYIPDGEIYFGPMWSHKDWDWIQGRPISSVFMYTMDTRDTKLDGDVNIRTCGATSSIGKTDTLFILPYTLPGESDTGYLMPEDEYPYPYQIYSCFVDCNYDSE